MLKNAFFNKYFTHIIYMPINLDKKIVFIHIPKTSGNFISDLLGMKHGMLTSGNNCLLDRTKQHYPINLILNVLKENKIDETNLTFFTILRNPYNRFISTYNQYPGNESFQKMINKKTKEEFADYLIERINSEGYDFFNYGSYHQFQPQWMYLNNNYKNVNVKMIKYNTPEYIQFIQECIKKYNLNYNIEQIKFHNYNISQELKNKIDVIYKDDFNLFT